MLYEDGDRVVRELTGSSPLVSPGANTPQLVTQLFTQLVTQQSYGSFGVFDSLQIKPDLQLSKGFNVSSVAFFIRVRRS